MSNADVRATSSLASQPGPGEWLTLPRFALALGLLLFVAFPEVWLGARSFFTRDFSTFGYPVAAHVQHSYRAGEIPLWNPYSFTGLPFLAQWNTLCLYPGSLLYIALPLPWSLNVFNLLHVLLGGLGAFALARRWLADPRGAAVTGIAYAGGGVMLSALMWPNNIAALGWLPWVWLAGERAARQGGTRVAGAAVVLALQFLTGAPEIIALTWAGLAVVVIGATGEAAIGRRLLRLAAVGAITLGLVAIQLLPFVELLRASQRDASYANASWSLTASALGNFLVPLFHTFQDRDDVFFQPNQQWVTSHYAGATVLLLALLALLTDRSPRVRWLTLTGLLALTLALGPAGGLYQFVRWLMPGLGMVRYPIKFLVPVALILPLLAGYGARAIFQRRVTPRVVRGLLLGLGLGVAGLLWQAAAHPLARENVPVTLHSGLVALTFLLLVWGVIEWTQRAAADALRWLAPGTLGLLVFGDLYFANRGINPTVPTAVMTRSYLEVKSPPRLGEGRVHVANAAHQLLDETIFKDPEPAVRIPRQALLLNANLLEGVPKLDGFFSLYLARPTAVVTTLSPLTNTAALGLRDFLGESHVSQAAHPWRWDARAQWLPLATLGAQPVFLAGTNAFARLFADDFDPRTEVILAPEIASQLTITARGPSRVVTNHLAPHRLEFTTEAAQPALLVLAQPHYPGWQARVDGRPVALWTANYAFQALEVPAGTHEVTVVFRSRSFELGAGLSLLTLLAVGVWGWRGRQERAEVAPPAVLLRP